MISHPKLSLEISKALSVVCYKNFDQILLPLLSYERIKSKQKNFINYIKHIKIFTSSEDKELKSYDVESLFSYVPIKGTKHDILHEIYVENKLIKLRSDPIIKQLLMKPMFEFKFFRHIDGCTRSGPTSITFSDICITKIEKW